MSRPKGIVQDRDESKYWLPDGVTLKPDQTTQYRKDTKLIFIDSQYGEFISSFKALQDANTSTHRLAVQKRREETNRAKYGGTNPSHSKDVRDKAKNTMIEKYGVEHALHNPDFLKKSQETTFSNYGVDNPMKSEVVKSRLNKTFISKYGVNNPGLIESDRFLVLPNGKLLTTYCKELKFESAISQAKVIYHRVGPELAQTWIEQYKEKKSSLELFVERKFGYENCKKKKIHQQMNLRPDFKITDSVYVDVDGLLYHSTMFKKGKDNYHFDKYKEYKKYGLTILQFRQDELYEKHEIIRSIIENKAGKSKYKVFARNTELRKVSKIDCESFLKSNHLMGISKGTSNIGLYYNDELVSLMTFQKHTKNNSIEIARFCNKLDYSIVGGFTKLLNYIQKNYTYSHIESFVDLRYGNGLSLEKLGFVLDSVEVGWKWTDGIRTFNRLQCRANMDERRLSEEQYAKELNWYKIYDAGQAKFILNWDKT